METQVEVKSEEEEGGLCCLSYDPETRKVIDPCGDELVVPEGWRLLRNGEVVQKGDKYSRDSHTWKESEYSDFGDKVDDTGLYSFIRKVEEETPVPQSNATYNLETRKVVWGKDCCSCLLPEGYRLLTIGEVAERDSDIFLYDGGHEPVDGYAGTVVTKGGVVFARPMVHTDPEPNVNPEALTDAEVLVERGKIYGDPRTSHSNIGKVWSGILGNHLDADMPPIPPEVVALMMAGLKLVRSARVYHEDNYVDNRNYIGFAEEWQQSPQVVDVP